MKSDLVRSTKCIMGGRGVINVDCRFSQNFCCRLQIKRAKKLQIVDGFLGRKILQIVDKNELKLLIFRGFAVDCRFIELFSCRLQTDYILCMVKLQMQIFEKKMMQIVDRMAKKVVINIQSDPVQTERASWKCTSLSV